mgnify:CR=1 FL=1
MNRMEEPRTEEDCQQLADTDLKKRYNLCYEEYKEFTERRSKDGSVNRFGIHFQPPGGRKARVQHNKKYDETHGDERARITHSLGLLRSEMEARGIPVKEPRKIEKIEDLYKYELLDIVDGINRVRSDTGESPIPRGKTNPELINGIKDRIGSRPCDLLFGWARELLTKYDYSNEEEYKQKLEGKLEEETYSWYKEH